MQLTSTLVLVLGALSSVVLAVPTYPAYNSNNGGASVNTGSIGVANVDAPNGRAAGDNLNNAIVGAAGTTGGPGSYNARKVNDLQARTGKNTQPQYINSPQASNEGSCSGTSSLSYLFEM